MKNFIFKKQFLILLISFCIMIIGISAVCANENTTDLNQDIEINDTDLGDCSIDTVDLKDSDVNKTNVSIKVNDFEMYYKNGTRLVGVLQDNESNPIANQNVTININSLNYTRVTGSDGSFGMNINLNPSIYDFTVSFNGSDIYNSASANATVTVLSTILSNDLTKYYLNDSKFVATLLDNQGNPLSNNTEVKFNINGVMYTRYTDENGTARLAINLNPAEYVITITHINTECKSYNITVESTIISNNFINYYQDGSKFNTTLIDGNGNPLIGAIASFNINGIIYNRSTDKDGIAQLAINLYPGEYIITTIHPNGELKANNVTVKPTIVADNLVKYYKNESKFAATFIDKNGNPLNNTNVTFNIHGVMYTRSTDENGTACLAINLEPGEYIITAFHPDGLQMGKTITVLSTLITYDISQPCYDQSGMATFDAQVLDGQGNPLSNASVTFSVSGKTLTKYTNETGFASINIKAYPGIYTITTTYNGYSKGNTLEIYNNETGFKRFNLGSNDNGSVYLFKSIGNTSSDVRIAYIIGVHVTEYAVHEALFNELTSQSNELSYCYDIYKVNVIPDGDVNGDRMKGQLLANTFVVPEVIKNNYAFVVDVHSNEGGAYTTTNFAFAPAKDNESQAIATKIINDNPGLSEYFPASQTSPPYVTIPIVNAGTPAVIYESYKFEDYDKITVPYVDLLIQSVDSMYEII